MARYFFIRQGLGLLLLARDASRAAIPVRGHVGARPYIKPI